jgi:hypothetical protein
MNRLVAPKEKLACGNKHEGMACDICKIGQKNRRIGWWQQEEGISL